MVKEKANLDCIYSCLSVVPHCTSVYIQRTNIAHSAYTQIHIQRTNPVHFQQIFVVLHWTQCPFQANKFCAIQLYIRCCPVYSLPIAKYTHCVQMFMYYVPLHTICICNICYLFCLNVMSYPILCNTSHNWLYRILLYSLRTSINLQCFSLHTIVNITFKLFICEYIPPKIIFIFSSI